MKCLKCGKRATWVEPPLCPTCNHQEEGYWRLTCDCSDSELLVEEMSGQVFKYKSQHGTLTGLQNKLTEKGELDES